MKLAQLRAPGLPVLAKELTEQAARRRTYIVRSIYALLLFAAALAAFQNVMNIDPWGGVRSVFGRGRMLFDIVVALQLLGVYLFMPALTCGVIAGEKERNTLGLLLLTRLGPWTIATEKFLSRLIPMGTYLLLSLPVIGYCYALGGVTQTQIWMAVWGLFVAAIQVGTLSLVCSAWFRSTSSAFIATYLVGLIFYFAIPFLLVVTGVRQNSFRFLADVDTALLQSIQRSVNGLVGTAWLEPAHDVTQDEALLMRFPPVLIVDATRPAWQTMVMSVPALAWSALFFGLARLFLVQRAFIPSRNLLLQLFRALDGFFHRINNNRITRGIVVINESTTLPHYKPVAWRETRKKSLGTTRYLIRIFVVLEFPILAFCLLLAVLDVNRPDTTPISLLLFLMWILAALLIVVKASTLIASERSHETLDVLLSTPMTGREFVEQKFHGVKRLMWVLAAPLLTLICFQTWWIFTLDGSGWSGSPRRQTLPAPLYFLVGIMSVGVYLPMLAYLGLYFSLRMKTQSRAIFTSLAVSVGWCVIPLVLLMPVWEWARRMGGPHDASAVTWLLLSSPAFMAYLNEFGATYFASSSRFLDESDIRYTLQAIVNFLWYGGVLFVLRRGCLRGAARYLGRSEPEPISDY